MHVVGTAGHVDHGKSTLVEALTGINPDRLKEERERAMTIDLGFAWLTLPNGEQVGVIDVPGHRDFIENMLAGVGGIDAALFVVAADEGVMPQTREHLAILDLLHVPSGVTALTKSDLVDEEWLSLIEADVATLWRGTALEGAPIVAVSARTGSGLPELKAALQAVLAGCPPRPDLGRPRLPIDRVFSMAGFGTVVTGTLGEGALALGDEVEILPDGLAARVRGLQTHKARIERALPGSRVAANLAGVEVGQLRRGMVVARPGTLRSTALLDVRLRHLPQAETALPLKHNAEVKFFLGAAEVIGAVRLLGRDALPAGEEGWAQIVLAEPVVAVKGDRFIVRRPSPGTTVGGGVVVEPHASRRRRRHDPTAISNLETLAQGTPGEVLLQTLDALGPSALEDALDKAGLKGEAAVQAVAEARESGQLVELDGEDLLASRSAWSRWENNIRSALAAYHATHPLRAGMPREEFRSRLEIGSSRVFNALLGFAARTGLAAAAGSIVRLPDHQVAFSPSQQAKVDGLLRDFRRDPYNTPSVKDSAARVGDEVLNALVEQGMLTQLSTDVVLLGETYAAMVAQIKAHLVSHGKVTVAQVRDMFSTSRKYALALMEYLDGQGITRRVGDERVLKT